MGIIDPVLGVLDEKFRTTSEVAERCGLAAFVVSASLATLRRNGLAEYKQGPGRISLWRRTSGDEGHGTRSDERARQLGEDREVGVQPDPIQPPDAER
jgi:DNA-binding IclR family transcriptional regulator